MTKLWWRFRLAFLMTFFDYTPRGRCNFLETWRWTGEEEIWLIYYDDDPRGRYSPMEALREDWSYQ